MTRAGDRFVVALTGTSPEGALARTSAGEPPAGPAAAPAAPDKGAVKADRAAVKADREKMKADIANKYGEGEFQGELHSVSIKLVAVSGTVDYDELCVAYGITKTVLNTFRKEGRADIKVYPKK